MASSSGEVRAGLEQQHPAVRVFGQPRGDHAAARSSANNDDVEIAPLVSPAVSAPARSPSDGSVASSSPANSAAPGNDNTAA